MLADKDHSVIWIRFIVGIIFISEGLQKFLFQDTLGIGRFIKIGIPYPEFSAPFVAFCEITFGFFILIGFATRIAFFPQIIIMIVALISTKLSILLNNEILPFLHEARNDLLIAFGLIFLFHKGSGAFSIDEFITNKRKQI
jgi:uncharacterized membrane protein YphA (DoxX/SURF4 family)